MTCPGCGSFDHMHNTRRHEASGIPIPPCAVGDRVAWQSWINTPEGLRYVEASYAQTRAAIDAAGALEGRDLVEALRSIGALRANVLEAIVSRAGDVLGVLVDELRDVEECTHTLCSHADQMAEGKIADVLRRILKGANRGA